MTEAREELPETLSPDELDTFAARMAGETRLDEGNDLVRKMALASDFHAIASRWTPQLRAHGRPDLEMKWHKEAVARGLDAYAIVRATEAAWLSDGTVEATRISDVFVGRLDDLPFRHNGDLFHRRQILLMLNDYKRLFRYEDLGGAPENDRRPVHPGVLAGLYDAIWHAQRVGDAVTAHLRIELYAALAADQSETVDHLVRTIVEPNGDHALAEALRNGHA